MLSLSVCEHEFCKECLSKYIELQVKESITLKIQCPICKKPDLSSSELTEYFYVVDQMVRCSRFCIITIKAMIKPFKNVYIILDYLRLITFIVSFF